MKNIRFSYNKKKILVLGISILIALAGVKLLEKSIIENQSGKQITYYAAATDLNPGDIISEQNTKKVVAKGEIELRYTEDLSEIVGLIVNEKIYEKEPIIKERLTYEIDDSVESKKQYSIKLLPEEAVAGTIRTGDMIKIIGTKVSNAATEAETDYIIKDENGQPKSLKVIKSLDSNGGELSGENVPAGMFILEVTKEEAKILDNSVSTRKIKLVKDNN